MPTNSKELECKGCGKKVVASMEAVSVLCGECTAAGKSLKSYFKDDKLNQEVKASGKKSKAKASPTIKTTPATNPTQASKPATTSKEPKEKRTGIGKWVISKITEGLSNEQITELAKKEMPDYKGNIKNIFGLQASRAARKAQEGK